MKRPQIEHSSAYNTDDATGSLQHQPSHALFISSACAVHRSRSKSSHRRLRLLTTPPLTKWGQGTRWHQAARGALNVNLTATLTRLLNVGWRPLTRVTATPGGAHAGRFSRR
jgi:hypothetical protein